ncbi:MAG: 2-hydroxychromene-2-carboxylate isomerase [Hyphomicrobiaceae bacterium]|nr:2-hydroxychromene-2-carboxylate isomerase [Hyphomicrobiaceae bacterium]
MTVTVDCFYTAISPYAYLGHQAFVEMAARNGVSVRFKPVRLFGVFEQTGGVPLPKRHPARLAYRWIELQRWREARGLPLNLKPAFWPADCSLADRAAILVAESGADAAAYVGKTLSIVWAEDKNIADEAVVAEALRETGHDAEAILEAVKAGKADAAYDAHTQEGADLGIIGSPCYVLNGEPFWGQDRIELLESAIRSGRAPFRPLS